VVVVGPLTTLAISPWTNFDPINLIKMLVVSSIGWSILGIILNKSFFKDAKFNIVFLVSIFSFILFLTTTLLFSGAPVTQQIWGQFGRSTGFLAYFSLAFISLGTSIVRDLNFYRKLILGMFLTVVPVTIYCLIQIAGIDPIGWSSYAPFGTLGNINLLPF
jgi:hypothetical protein